MITEIQLSFGASPNQPPLSFAPGPVTVFVGPNNSGKSLLLRETSSALLPTAHRYGISLDVHIPPEKWRIVRQIRAVEPDWNQLRAHCEKAISIGTAGTAYLGSLLSSGQTGHTDVADLLKMIDRQGRADLIESLRVMVRRSQVEILDGQRRLNLVDARPSGNLKQPPTNVLQALFRDDVRRGRLAEMTREAFGMYFTLDPTATGSLSVAMSNNLPETVEEERSLSEKAIRFFSAATPTSELSDGVKAYTGILAAVLSTDLKVILIDEPDAFLHPPLARRLGGALTILASERDANVIAATHDSHFLMGCIQAGKPVNVVRLTFAGGVATARLLEADRLRKMMLDPLLRSTRIMDALFHQGAVICEADADRAFYQEVNDRLLASGREGASDCMFLNAQNKQTIRRIVQPLREMGIPAAAVVDLDVVKKSTNNDLRDLMGAAHVPDGLVKTYGQLRGEVEAAFTAKNLNPKREGINSLEAAQRETVEKLLSCLMEYGIFVTPVGELERWLSSLGVPSNTPEQKHDWLASVFDKMGSDPDDAGYLKPGQGDVWSFVQQIAQWVANPSRKGMA